MLLSPLYKLSDEWCSWWIKIMNISLFMFYVEREQFT